MAYAIIVPGSFRVGVPKSGPLTRENLTRSFQPTGGTQPEWHLCDTSLCRSGWRLARAASDAAPDSPAGRGGRPDRDSGASYGTRRDLSTAAVLRGSAFVPWPGHWHLN
jgi:hypothetical protein